MRVYRVENKDGFGPYTGIAAGLVDWDSDDFTGDRHPSTFLDKRLAGWNVLPFVVRQQYHHGFESEGSFLHWFHKRRWLEALEAARFRLSIYEVDNQDVARGSSQVVFRRDKAKLVDTVSLLTYIPLIEQEMSHEGDRIHACID